MNAPTPEAIKALREKHDLQQVQLAQLVYVSRRTVQYWEEGERAMPRSAWELVNIRLGEMEPVPTADLLAQVIEPSKPKSGRAPKA